MVSKRSRYISESTSDDNPSDMEYTPNNQILTSKFAHSSTESDYLHQFQQKKAGRKPTRTPNCFSKNALMARENRLKKKVYMSKLENQVSSMKNQNKQLSAIVENQSFMIEEFKKEVKYLKSVISNSSNIGKLIRAINLGTGMPVTSSLAGTTCKGSEPTQALHHIDNWQQIPENKTFMVDSATKHPWEEKYETYKKYPTPESTNSYYSNPEFDELNNDVFLADLDIPLQSNSDELQGFIHEIAPKTPIVPIDEHNYHNPVKFEPDFVRDEEDVGVCLHVSKNKVSLEFCPTCSDNALQSQRLTLSDAYHEDCS